jgi:regulator of sigma E protease
MEHIGGFQESLILAAAISIILAVMNLLPIPALDGGHLLFLAIEAIKGSPVKKEIQEKVMQGGFLVLMSMMVFVFFNDINNMFLGGGQPSKEPPKAPPPIKCPVYPTS